MTSDSRKVGPPELSTVDCELSTAVPECLACGACCFSHMQEYVRVFGIDLDRMDERAQGHTHFIGNKCFMRMEGGRCTALGIDPAMGRFACSIYEMRPDVCRSLERGLSQCRAERHEKHERPLIAAAALLAARPSR